MFWRQLRTFMLIFFITILQEVVFLIVQLHIPQDTLNYSDVTSIFQDVMPMQTFGNYYTHDGTFTNSLFEDYRDVQN